MTEEQVLVLKADTMQPGDVVVLQTSQPVSPEQAAALKQRLCDRMPWLAPGDIVLLAGMSMSIVRPPAE